MSVKLGSILKILRVKKKLKQIDMANLLNVQQSTYARYESNSSKPDIDVLITLATFFEVTVDFLLGIENKKSSISPSNKISQEDIELLENIKNLPERDKKIIDTFITTNTVSKESIASGK